MEYRNNDLIATERRIKSDVEQYLASGGQIQQIPAGQCTVADDAAHQSLAKALANVRALA